jgi:hypothetical protein
MPPSKAGALAPRQRLLRGALISALVLSAAALGIAYNLDTRFWVYLIVVGVHLLLTAALHLFVPQAPKPAFTSPLFPYVPSASLLVNAWLCSTLPGSAWVQYAIFLAIVCAVYFAYSIAGSLALEEHSPARAEPSLTGAPPPLEVARVMSLSRDGCGVEEVDGAGEGPAAAGAGAEGLHGVKAVELV